MMRAMNIHKKFGNNEVLKGIDLEVNDGQVVVLLGPSGSGKTTLLRCLNCLEMPDQGKIIINDKITDITQAKKSDILNIQRQTAMVFQNHALFANCTALDNIALPLVLTRGESKGRARKLAQELLVKVELSEVGDLYPCQLSGGQQQRVGIARALALNPEVVLFDEPTSALDPELVGQTLALLKKLATEGTTMILVTHEMKFAYEVADTIVFMENGVIVEMGSAQQVFEEPKHIRTKDFLSRFTDQLMAG